MNLRRFLPVLAIAAAIGSMAPAETRLSVPNAPDKAARQISVVVDRGLTRTTRLPTRALRAARRAMIAGEPVAAADLRALADRQDGLAALRYVRALVRDHAGDPAHASDIAYYAAVAVGTGRVWPLPDMIAAMHQIDPDTEPAARVNKYISVLYAHAWAGNPLALDAVIDFNGAGRLFGPLSDETRARILAQSAKNGGGRAELRMAIDLMSNPERTAEQTELARRYLDRAAQVKDLAIRTTAINLLLSLESGDT